MREFERNDILTESHGNHLPSVQLLYKQPLIQFLKNWLRSPADEWAQCKHTDSTTKPMTILMLASILFHFKSNAHA